MTGTKITTRLWISFGALLVILAATFAVYEWQAQQISNRVNQLAEVQLPAAQAIYDMQRESTFIARYVAGYATDFDPAYIQQLHTSETELTGAGIKYDNLAAAARDKSETQTLTSMNTDFIDAANQTISLIDRQHAAYIEVQTNLNDSRSLLQGMLAAYAQENSPDAHNKLVIVLNMQNDLDKVYGYIDTFLAKPDSSIRQQVLNTADDFKQLSTSLQNSGLTTFESNWLVQMNNKFNSLINNTGNLFTANDNLTAGTKQFQNVFNSTEATLSQQAQSPAGIATVSSVEDLKTATTSTGICILILCLVGIITGTASVIFISRRLAGPIRQIVKSAGLVGSGRIENRFNAEVKGEFGQVALSLNKMLDSLKRSQDALSESEELAWAILDATHDAVVLIDAKGNILASNEIAASRFGRSLEQMIDVCYYDLLSTESAASLRAHVTEILNTHKPVHYEDEPEDKIIEHDVFPVFGHRGDVSRIAVFSRDITMRKWIEDVTEQLGRRNALILESAGEGIFGLDAEGKTTFVNPAGARALGYQPEELKGKIHHDVVHHSRPDGRFYPHDQCPIYATFKDGNSHSNIDDEVFWRKDGTSFQVEYSSTPIIENGRILGAVVTFRDISDRKRVEKALLESEEKYRSVIESAASLVVWLDREGIIIDSNPRVEQFLGYTQSEIIGRPFNQLVQQAYRSHVEEILIEAISGAPEHDYHLHLDHKKGGHIEVSMNIGIARDTRGNYACTICMICEVNGRARLQHQNMSL